MSKIDTSSEIPVASSAASLQEKISSMVDGELESQECSEVLAQMSANADTASWDQYHLIGEAMRHNLPDTLYTDLATHVSAAVASESTHQCEPLAQASDDSHATGGSNVTPLATQTKNPLWGYAMAASMSAIAIAGLYQFNQGGQLAAPMLQPVAALQQVTPGAVLDDISWSHDAKQAPVLVENRYPLSRIPNEKLHRYIINHNEQSMAMPAQGAMLPYARLVGYENAQ